MKSPAAPKDPGYPLPPPKTIWGGAMSARPCLGPFQDAVVAEAIAGIKQVFAKVAADRGVDETDLHAWVGWAALRDADNDVVQERKP